MFLAPPRILATSDGRALRECLPDTRLAPKVPSGVVGTRGVGRTNSGGVTTRPDPTTGSRNPRRGLGGGVQRPVPAVAPP
ncbi:MAG: hypothetical protein WBL53_12115, partial [Pseudonocardiaceae bacterium]